MSKTNDKKDVLNPHTRITEMLSINNLEYCIAKEDVLDENGNISLEKLDAIVYSPTDHKYYKIGEKVGNAFSDGKKLV